MYVCLSKDFFNDGAEYAAVNDSHMDGHELFGAVLNLVK